MKRLAMLVAVLALVAACSSSDDSGGDSEPSGETTVDDVLGDPGDCTVVDMAVSPEKIDLLTDLASTFNRSARPRSTASASSCGPRPSRRAPAPQLLAEGWDEDDRRAAAGGLVARRRAPGARSSTSGSTEQGEPPMAGEGTPFMLTPLVIAMPEPMAEALGWPDEPIGWADILELATDPQGWAAYGHPEWGPFRLGKTNPNFSTSGLSALIAQSYAATGKTEGLTDARTSTNPDVIDFATGVESAVVHYGDTTLTFLNNLVPGGPARQRR